MNWKLALLLPGAIALSFAAAPMLPGISAPVSSTIAQAQPRANKLNLNLTDDQKAKLKQIREETESKIQAVLTADQRQQLATLKQQRQAQRQQGQGQPRAARQKGDGWAALNLTADQKAQIRQIRESAKQEREAVFTPEQRQQLETLKQQHQQRRQQRQANPSAQPGT